MAIDFNDKMMEQSQGPSLIIAQGLPGQTPTLEVGTVETVSSTEGADVTMESTQTGAKINFKIPRGPSGSDDIDDTAGSGDTDKVYSADKTWQIQQNALSSRATEIITAENYTSFFTDAINAARNSVYYLHGISNIMIAGLPAYVDGYLITMNARTNSSLPSIQIYMTRTTNEVYHRFSTTSGTTDWVKMPDNASVVQAIMDNAVHGYGNTSAEVSPIDFDDCNSMPHNVIYGGQIASGTLANLPSEYSGKSFRGLLAALSHNYSVSGFNVTVQLALDYYNNRFWIRMIHGTTRESWYELPTKEYVDALVVQSKVLDTEGNLFKIFKRVGVIGDSLSVGWTWNDDDNEGVRRNPLYCWPWYMANDANAEYILLGQSGYDVHYFMESSEGYGLTLAQAAGKCQAYILALGYNDSINHNGEMRLGSPEDILDPVMSSDSTSFYAGYAMIIYSLKQISPGAKIFCMTMPTLTNNFNTAIRWFVEESDFRQDLYLLDLRDDLYKFYFDSETLIDNDKYHGHYTSVGYSSIAKVIENCMNTVIAENQDEFQQVTFLPYDETGNEVDIVINQSNTNKTYTDKRPLLRVNTDVDATTATGGHNYGAVDWYDKNGIGPIGSLRLREASGRIGVGFGGRNNNNNMLTCFTDLSGNVTYDVGDKSAFRSAIEAPAAADCQMKTYVNGTPDQTKTVYQLYSAARTLYGTGSWTYTIMIGQIDSSSTLAQSVPVKPCVLTITQFSNSNSERAALTCQGVSSAVIKYNYIWQGSISSWY